MTCENCEEYFAFSEDLSPRLRKKFTSLCQSLLTRCDDSEATTVEENLADIEFFLSRKDASGFSFKNCKKLANCLVQAGRSPRAIQLLEKIRAKDLHHDFDHLVALGQVYKKLGEYQSALEFFKRARANAELVDDHVQLALSSAKIAACYSNLENPTALREYFELSLEMLEFCKHDNNINANDLMVSAYKEIAFLHGIVNSDYRSGITCYQEALTIVQNGPNSCTIKVCKLLSKISYCFSVIKDKNAVDRYNSSVLFLTEDVLKNSACVRTHIRALIHVLSRTALSYGYVSLFEQGFRVNVKALELTRKYVGDTCPEVARIASGIFKQCHRLSKPECEEKGYLAICEKSLNECGYRGDAEKSRMYVRHVSDSLSNCAEVFARMKQHLRAEKYYNEALELNQFVFGELHPRNGRIMQMLARVYRRRGKPQRARQVLQNCIRIYEICKPRHQKLLKSLRGELAKI